MSLVGRNDPCPCGSGRKFKKCCLNKSGAASQSYRSGERDSALAKLMRFSARAEFRGAHEAALDLFWGDRLLEERDEELKQVMGLEQVEIAYNSWFSFDFDLGDGRRPIDVFLQREGEKLSSGERNYLDRMPGSHLRLYEIIDVDPDQGFEVRDLWDDQRLVVRERAATRHLVAWDLIVARVGQSGGGETVFETLTYRFPAADKDELLKGLRKAHEVFLSDFPGQNIEAFFKTMAPVFHRLWLDRVALPPRPQLITGDGEPFVFAKVLFDLVDRQAAINSLADRDDIVDHGDGSYVWLGPAGIFQRSVGTIVIEANRVVFETTSQKRAEKARDFLPNLMQGAIRFRVISYEDVGHSWALGLRRASLPKIKVTIDHLVLRLYLIDFRRILHLWIRHVANCKGSTGSCSRSISAIDNTLIETSQLTISMYFYRKSCC